MEFKTEFGRVTVEVSEYTNNGRVALILNDAETGEQVTVLTVNLPDATLEEGEFAVKDWTENKSIARDALASGYFVDTGKRIATGFVQAPVWRLKGGN